MGRARGPAHFFVSIRCSVAATPLLIRFTASGITSVRLRSKWVPLTRLRLLSALSIRVWCHIQVISRFPSLLTTVFTLWLIAPRSLRVSPWTLYPTLCPIPFPHQPRSPRCARRHTDHPSRLNSSRRGPWIPSRIPPPSHQPPPLRTRHFCGGLKRTTRVLSCTSSLKNPVPMPVPRTSCSPSRQNPCPFRSLRTSDSQWRCNPTCRKTCLRRLKG